MHKYRELATVLDTEVSLQNFCKTLSLNDEGHYLQDWVRF
jgi:hypothetical protein